MTAGRSSSTCVRSGVLTVSGERTSNSLFSDSAEVTDNDTGLIFVHDPPFGSAL
jgi:hypothetical protein